QRRRWLSKARWQPRQQQTSRIGRAAVGTSVATSGRAKSKYCAGGLGTCARPRETGRVTMGVVVAVGAAGGGAAIGAAFVRAAGGGTGRLSGKARKGSPPLVPRPPPPRVPTAGAPPP